MQSQIHSYGSIPSKGNAVKYYQYLIDTPDWLRITHLSCHLQHPPRTLQRLKSQNDGIAMWTGNSNNSTKDALYDYDMFQR